MAELFKPYTNVLASKVVREVETLPIDHLNMYGCDDLSPEPTTEQIPIVTKVPKPDFFSDDYCSKPSVKYGVPVGLRTISTTADLLDR